MACASCEQRRQWVKRHYDNSKESIRLCIDRLSGKPVEAKQSAAKKSKHTIKSKQSSDQSEQSADSDHQRAERPDQ